MTPAFYEDLRGEMTLEEWNVVSKTAGAASEPQALGEVGQVAKSSKGAIGYGL